MLCRANCSADTEHAALLRREPLPPLFMRFVMQAGFAWPALTPLTVDLLCKLIGKQARLAVTVASESAQHSAGIPCVSRLLFVSMRSRM